MNTTFAIAAATMALFFSPTLLIADETRLWTATSGTSIQAVFVKETAGTVTLRKADGNMVQVSRSNLSTQDNEYLDRFLNKGKLVTISLRPNTAAGTLVYTEGAETNPRPKKLGEVGTRDLTMPKNYNSPEVMQGDTLSYRFFWGGKWNEDSTWRVIAAEDLRNEIIGNANHKEDRRKTEGRFIRVVFELANKGTFESPVPSPEIVDAKERQFSYIDNQGDFIGDQYTDPRFASIRPGFTKIYAAIYELPVDATGLKLRVPTFRTYNFEGTDMPMGSKTITLDVRKTNAVEKGPNDKRDK